MRLETDRLLIRSCDMGDVPDYADVIADPEVMRYLGGPQGPQDARAYVADCVARDRTNGISRYAVVHRSTGTFIGFCGFKALVRDDGTNWVDFGWRYKPAFWRQGLGTEAARAVLEFGKSDLKLSGIEVQTHEHNAGTLRIIELLGFQWAAEFETDIGIFHRFVENP